MDPHQVPFVEALDDAFGKESIDSVVRAPQFGFTTTTAVNRSLFNVVHGIFAELCIGGGGGGGGAAAAASTIASSTGTGGTAVSASHDHIIVFFGFVTIHGCNVVDYRPQYTLAKTVVHVSKKDRIDPYGDTIERSQTLFDQVTFVTWDTTLGMCGFTVGIVSGVVGMVGWGGLMVGEGLMPPTPPFDDTDTCDPQMCLHRQQNFVIPIGTPNPGIGTSQNDRQEDTYHDQTIGRIEMDGLFGDRRCCRCGTMSV